ncbi:hypothetical protein GTCCBUS3UF5_34690 [Geobacillus thermoleovorans CCB_US3_UF5]|uniref:Uncharacterized protein n=1 Tax=Geobacillus thermoleovorans CCB_US3_UF5 TaxID=1111068 RepID=A0ABN4A5J7_GEOTH|nr:hypothetical protein GTCCBUS3UF5_34690 [Geobacillus thermoleovorans CCB_US3_UF5]
MKAFRFCADRRFGCHLRSDQEEASFAAKGEGCLFFPPCVS